LTTLAARHLDCNQIDDALKAIDEVMSLSTLTGDMERHYVYFNRALCLKRKGRYIEAFNNAQLAAGLLPTYAKPWYNAACYASLASTLDGKYLDKAVQCLKKAYELSPQYTRAYAIAPTARAYDSGVRVLPNTADPDLDAIRGLPEFRAIFGQELGEPSTRTTS